MSVFHVFLTVLQLARNCAKHYKYIIEKIKQRLNIYVTMDIFFRVLRELNLFKERIGKAQTPILI